MGLRLISTAVVSTLGLAACTSILGNDFTIREDGPGAGGSGPTTTSTTGTIGGGGSGAGDGCAAGTADCNGDASDGCEVMIDADADHCGACDRACSTDGTDAVACSGGVCTSTCAAGAANCSQPAAPSADDGCETTLGSDTACAACGHDCEGGTCTGGQCTAYVLNDDFGGVSAMDLDAESLFWTNEGNSTIESIPIGGGGVNALQNNAGQAVDIALDATHVYWCSGPSGVTSRVAKTGGAPDFFTGLDVLHLDVSDAFVYFVSSGLRRIPKAGGSEELINNATTADVVADGTEVFFSSNQAVVRLDESGGQPTPVFQLGGNDLPNRLAMDATHVYFTGVNQIWRGERGGATLFSEIANGPSGSPADLAVNSTHVYFTVTSAGEIQRAPVDGGPIETVATGFPDASAIAANDEAVFWGRSTTGSIYKVVLPPAN